MQLKHVDGDYTNSKFRVFWTVNNIDNRIYHFGTHVTLATHDYGLLLVGNFSAS